MNIGIMVTISCVLTFIVMAVYSSVLFILIQSGGRGVQAIVNRFLGGGKQADKEADKDKRDSSRPRPQVSSGEALRQRAQQLDFNPQAGYGPQAGGFSAQDSSSYQRPQQATLTSRDPLRPPQANPPLGQAGQFGQASPSMPSLSSARPFQPGTQPPPAAGTGFTAQSGQLGQYGQQPLRPQQGQYGQQPSFPPQQGQLGQQPSFPRQPANPEQGQYGQPPLSPQQGQYGQQPPFPQQPTNPQQGQYGQPPPFPQQPGNPQQGTIGQYRPTIRRGPDLNAPLPPESTQRRPLRRDTRKQDDHDEIVDDDILGNIGDALDF